MGQELVEYDGTSVTTHDIRLGGSDGAWHPTSTLLGLAFVGNNGSTGREPHYFDGSNFNIMANLNNASNHSMQDNDFSPFGSTSSTAHNPG